MKILSVNPSPVEPKTQLSTCFRGLWGKPENSSVGNDYVYVSSSTKNYFPFKDENIKNPEELSKVREKWSVAGAIMWDFDKTAIHQPLSFTEKEYQAYKEMGKGFELSETAKSIEKELISKGLIDYLNPDSLLRYMAKMTELRKQNSLKFKLGELFKNFKAGLKQVKW